MKEKIFEELIKEKTQRENFFMLTDVGEKFMVQLLQQVREATKAECMEIAWNEEDSAFIHEQIASLEADRIRIEP